MTKQVLITIKGLQMPGPGEEATNIELITAGDYYKKNGHHFIMYDEVTEGFDGNTQNYIKLKEGSVEVRKKGVSNAHMIFQENKKNLTYYSTPYGRMEMGISATKVQIHETQENIDVNVDYALEINDQHVADCNICINIKSKDAQDFSLRS
jgi:uncharacterized beta-barrel protein YwiB (DUF1934 family)